MRQAIIGVFLLFTLVSWKADLKGPWITTKGKRIILHTRPLNYTKTKSPDSLIIQRIIQEQEQTIDFVNERIKTDFNSKVEIFLYNFDEATEKIGTNGGGFASMNGRQIFFTYYGNPIFNTVRNTYEYVGVHEMVHLITLNEIGNIRTRFFGEGYANALDGNYGSKLSENKLIRLRNDSTLVKIKAEGKLLKPSELLYKDSIPEREYYPQIGCLINWLFNTYGVENINKLYSQKREKIEDKFYKVTGVKFVDMERKYLEYQLTH